MKIQGLDIFEYLLFLTEPILDLAFTTFYNNFENQINIKKLKKKNRLSTRIIILDSFGTIYT